MSMNDPIADMLTRIRNASLRKHKRVAMPHSIIKGNIAKILMEEGFISSVNISDDKKTLELGLKYFGVHSDPVIRSIKRVSKPGLRTYAGHNELKPVLNGQGIQILSTSSGIRSDNYCKANKLGGEILCSVY